jgi:two-component system response regulator NreC
VADKIRILIADDHTIVRAGVRLLLEAEPDIEVIGEASNGDEALQLATSRKPDVVLMDIAMPGMHGLEATRKIKSRFADMHVLVLTMHRSDEYFFEMLKAGASGYMLKGAETNDLISAVRTVAEGQVFLQPSMTKRLLEVHLQRLQEAKGFEQPVTTPREREILLLLAEGYSNKEIAERLFISLSTVYSHRTNLMEKLNLSRRHDLIQYAREHGLLYDFS